MVKKDAGVKILVLDKDNYFHWKVKMHLHLMYMDERYVDCIQKGPHVPMKAASRVGVPDDAPDVEIPKPVSEWTIEDVAEIHKDKRTMNILFNGLEKEMFDNVINCTTSKEVWDTVRTLSGETLNDTFSRFQKLLNGLKLYGRIYQTKDSNFKFLRALPKEWKPMTVSLRNTQEYKDYTLERLYGTLKTYELEMEQDEEIEKVQKKGGSIALIASVNQLEDDNEEAVKATTSRASCRSDVSKGKGKMTEEEEPEPANLDDLDEIDEHIAFLSRKFSKFKFKRNSEARPPRRDFQPSKNNWIEKSKSKCFNCGMLGHFAGDCRKPKVEKGNRKFEPVDYKKKYFELLKQKEKDFMSQEYDWAGNGEDSDDDVEYVNLALMANNHEQEASSSSNQVTITNLSELSKEECDSAVNEMSTVLYNLRVTLKSLTKENSRIKETNLLLSDRNAMLEAQLIEFEKMRCVSRNAKKELENVLEREEILKTQLEIEQSVIAKWKDARNVATNIINVQGMESFCEQSWKKNKEKLGYAVETLESVSESTNNNDHLLKVDMSTECTVSLTDEPSTDQVVSLTEKRKEELTRLNNKYGPVTKNFVQGESSKSKKVEKPVERANVGHLSNKQLKDKLENVQVEAKGNKKNNRNGKVGINKHNNYTPDKYAPRKTCVNCGSVSHLSTNCKSVKKTAKVKMSKPAMNGSMPTMPVMPNMFAPYAQFQNPYASMSFVPNPYMNMFNVPQMPWNMNNMFVPPTMHAVNENVSNPQKSTPRVKIDLNQSEPKVKNDIKGKAKANKTGPKETWVPKINLIWFCCVQGDKRNLWYLDSGCSRHMTGDSTLLTEFQERAGPCIAFGDDSKGYTKGYGLISKENVIIDEVALVDGLKHNLLSISQLCDKGFLVTFSKEACVVSKGGNNNVVMTGFRRGNVYIADFSSTSPDTITCLFSKASKDESWLWHKKLSHLNFKVMNDLVRKDLARGIPQVEFSKDGLCDACQKGKQKKASFKSKTESSIVHQLELLHMDLFGPVNVMSISKKKYCLVIVDDFSRFTWTFFLHSKDEASEIIINHIKMVNNHPNFKVRRIRSDNGT
ncbi:hypothetical protein POM88_015372 [Heracleum sosnowskyi]|uniref:Uncharacterized protein n=1 Tax=Heracleum sosnowskyi TaxID=360622 RepID=A0AAD8ILH9_9APIA|nr:hypothetical protein POM88_015372 [Heracleum sosnowskyi]